MAIGVIRAISAAIIESTISSSIIEKPFSLERICTLFKSGPLPALRQTVQFHAKYFSEREFIQTILQALHTDFLEIKLKRVSRLRGFP